MFLLRSKQTEAFPLGNQRGVTLLIVLIMVVVMGLAAGVAGTTWKSVMHRAREQELLWRGDQYRRAIESYYNFTHGGKQGMYPSSLDDLLKDPRTPQGMPHIRKLYKDPFTDEDFELVRQSGKIKGLPGGAGPTVGPIIGVRSTSGLEPFKKDGFDKVYEDFADAETYQDWEFVFTPPKKTASAPAKTPPQPDPTKKAPQAKIEVEIQGQ